MTTTSLDRSIVPADELIERARALVPVLRGRSTETARLRRLPSETVQDLIDIGLVRALVKPEFGGMGHKPELIMSIAMEIARADGSAGWLSSFYPLHQFMIGWFGRQAQEEYFADGPNTLSSTVTGYKGTDRREEGEGLRISGTWGFSSGIDHAAWILLMLREEFCLIPRSDYEIIDDWYVAGLRGTGSNTVKVIDVYVPPHRIVKTADLRSITQPGLQTGHDGPWYRVSNPVLNVMNHFIQAPHIGMARGVADLFLERARTRLESQTFEPAFERPGTQLRLAEATIELDCAESLLKTNQATVRSWGEAAKQPSLLERAKMRLNVVYAAKLVAQATNRLVDGIDSSGLKDENLIARQAADARAAGLQVALHWDETAIQYARLCWGLEPQTKLI